MAPWISTAHNNARLQGSLDALNTGAGLPRIEFYDGTRPSGGGTATNLICTIELDDPAGSVVSDQLVLSVPQSGMVLIDATVTWARFFNGAGDIWGDFDATDEAGAGPVKLEAVDVLAGGLLRLVSAVFV